MANHSKGYFSKFMLCLIIFMIMFEFSIGDEVEVEAEATTPTTVDDHQATTVDDHHQEEIKKPVGVTTEYWEKAKLLLQHTHGYFFPPNLEGNEEGEGTAGKSMEKSKSTVEESAKTAAKYAEETLHTTTDTVLKATGLSSSQETPQPQQEHKTPQPHQEEL